MPNACKKTVSSLVLALVALSGSAWADGFTDNGDGTVADAATGLTWLKSASCCKHSFDCASALEPVGDPFEDCTSDLFREMLEIDRKLASVENEEERAALEKAREELGWRLPSKTELESLLQRIAPVEVEVPFEDVMFVGEIRNSTREDELRLFGEFRLGYYLHGAGGYCRLGGEKQVECAGLDELCRNEGPFVLKSWFLRAGS